MKKLLFGFLVLLLASVSVAQADKAGGLASQIRLQRVEVMSKAYSEQYFPVRYNCETSLPDGDVKQAVSGFYIEWTEVSMSRPAGAPSEGVIKGNFKSSFEGGFFQNKLVFRWRGKYRLKVILNFGDGSSSGPITVDVNVI